MTPSKSYTLKTVPSKLFCRLSMGWWKTYWYWIFTLSIKEWCHLMAEFAKYYGKFLASLSSRALYILSKLKKRTDPLIPCFCWAVIEVVPVSVGASGEDRPHGGGREAVGGSRQRGSGRRWGRPSKDATSSGWASTQVVRIEVLQAVVPGWWFQNRRVTLSWLLLIATIFWNAKTNLKARAFTTYSPFLSQLFCSSDSLGFGK